MQTIRKNNTMLITIIAGIIVLASLGTAAFFAKNYFDLQQNPNKASEEEVKRLTAKVGKLYQLPADETPIIGKVQDKEKLKEQPFFKNAENNDDILIYQTAKVAIIYREKDNKLINVGPIAIDSAPQQGQAAASVKFVAGTTQNQKVQSAISSAESIAGLSIDKTPLDAKKKTVAKTIVVDVSGSKGELAKQIADKLGGTVGAVPAGEDTPQADIAIFVGSD